MRRIKLLVHTATARVAKNFKSIESSGEACCAYGGTGMGDTAHRMYTFNDNVCGDEEK